MSNIVALIILLTTFFIVGGAPPILTQCIQKKAQKGGLSVC